jgi:single-strand DNA-binding protein
MNEPTITVIGNLTDQPEIRFLPTGAAMARFRVASTPRTYDKATGQWKDGDALFLPCTAWRDLAEHIADSNLTKGARVIVTGRLRQSHWETDAGEKRSMIQLDVDEVGPSLRFATATVKKLTRSNGNSNGFGAPDDPFATASPTRPTDPTNGTSNGAGSGTGGGFDDKPPF